MINIFRRTVTGQFYTRGKMFLESRHTSAVACNAFVNFSVSKLCTTKRTPAVCDDSVRIPLQSQEENYPYILSPDELKILTKQSDSVLVKLVELLEFLKKHRSAGYKLPPSMSLSEMEHLISFEVFLRTVFLHHLTSTYQRRMNRLKFRQERRLERELKKLCKEQARAENFRKLQIPDYELNGNALFPRISRQHVMALDNYNLSLGMLYGQNVVIDFSFERIMNERDLKRTCAQIKESIVLNKKHQHPFHLNFCNLEKNSVMYNHLERLYPTLFCKVPVTVTNESYINLFPRCNIVYLTPHSKSDLVYSPEDIYVIGGLNVSEGDMAYSVTRAEVSGVRTARFPIELFQLLPPSSYNLSIDMVLKILLSLQKDGCWSPASELGDKHKSSVIAEKVDLTQLFNANAVMENSMFEKAGEEHKRTERDDRDCYLNLISS